MPDRKLEALRPWGESEPSTPHPMLRVPWNVFTYRFNPDSGQAHPCAERFKAVKDPEGNVVSWQRVIGTVQLFNCPKLTFAQTEKLYDYAEREGKDLVTAYAELFGLDDLNGHQQRALANAPRYSVVSHATNAEVLDRKAEQTRKLEALRAVAGARPSVAEKATSESLAPRRRPGARRPAPAASAADAGTAED